MFWEPVSYTHLDVYKIQLLFSIMTQEMGPVTFTVTPDTYVEGQETLKTGDSTAAFYDTEAPVPLIYPPRYQAVLMAETDDGLFAAFDYFDENLVNTCLLYTSRCV